MIYLCKVEFIYLLLFFLEILSLPRSVHDNCNELQNILKIRLLTFYKTIRVRVRVKSFIIDE